MVGRDKELAKLELQVLKTINGEGSVINVIGEAGIGKSRLIAELKSREIMNNVAVLEGRAISIGKNLPFHPIIDLLKNWANIFEDDSQTRAFNKLEQAVRAIHPKDTEEILPFVATLMGMKLKGRYAERMEGIEGEALEKLIVKNVRDLVIKGSELRPTIMIMEDLHWADNSSIELLEALYRLAENCKLLFINMFRPGYLDEKNQGISNIGKRLPVYFVEIEIQPLERNDSETLIKNMLEIKGLPFSIRDQIVKRAGGNPFFIEEVVRSLIDEGAVVKRELRFEVTNKIHSVVIPPTINDVLMARIDRLEKRTRELVKVASVIGRNFFDRIIKEVADSIDNLDDRLSYLKDIQLIRDRIRMRELEYLFKHALAQEAAYASTLLQQRKLLHLKVAHATEKLFQERLHEFYGMLAHHYSMGEDVEKAEEYLTKAGEEALRSSASSEALNYLRDALELYVKRYGENSDPEKLTNFKKNLAIAHFNRGHWAEALHYFDEILIARGYRFPQGKLISWFRAYLELIILVAYLYIPTLHKTKIPNLKDVEDCELLRKKCICLDSIDYLRLFLEGVSWLRIMQGWDLHDIPGGYKLSAVRAGGVAAMGLFSLSKRWLNNAESVAIKQNRTDSIELAFARIILAMHQGSWNSAPIVEPSIVDLGLKSGAFFEAVNYLQILGLLKMVQGQFEHAELCAQKLKWIAENYAYNSAQIECHRVKADILIRKGEFHQALIEVDSGLLMTDQASMRPLKLSFLGRKAISNAFLGQIDEAQLSISEGESVLAELRTVGHSYLMPFYLGRLLTQIQLLKKVMRREDPFKINRHKKKVLPLLKQAVGSSKKFAPYRTWMLRLMGEYFWLIDKQGKAFKWWNKSIQECERLGASLDLSRTYFEVGKCLLEPKSKYTKFNGIDAKGYIEKAGELFEEMDLQWDLDELVKITSDR